MWQTSELPLLHRVEKADVAERPQRRREQARAHVDHRDARVRARERIEDPHLIGDRSDVDDVGDVGMKPHQRALGRFGVERPCRHVVGREVIQQRTRYRGLADTALVRSYNDHRWLGHGRSFSNRRRPELRLTLQSQSTGQLRLDVSALRRFPQVAFA